MKSVVVVGVGALGSHLVLFLRNEDIKLTVVDMDRVEMQNLASQFHTLLGLRKLKVQALRQSMRGLFKRDIFDYPRKLEEENVEALLGEADLVVDCTDNIAARTLIQGFCKEQNIDLLHGALSADGEFGRCIWSEQFTADSEDVEGQATCEGGEFLPFIALVSSHLAITVQAYLKDGTKRGVQVTPFTLFRV